MHIRSLALLSSILICLPAAAQTAVPTFDLEHLVLEPGGRDSLVLGTGDGLHAQAVRASLTLHYAHDPLDYVLDGTRVGAVVGARLTGDLGVAYGVRDWLEIGFQVPVILTQGGDVLGAQGIAPVQGSALGSPRLEVRGTLLRQAAGAAVDLGVAARVGLPFGSAAALNLDPGLGFSFLPSVGVGRAFSSFVRVGLEVGARLRSGAALSPYALDPHDDVGSSLSVGAVASTLGDGLRGELDLLGTIPLTRTGGAFEVLVGGRYPLAGTELEAYALVGPGFGEMPGTPLFRVLAGIAWSPGARPACREGRPYALADCPDLDRDGDGIANAADACPSVKGLAPLKGCPDADTDGDGVLNLADRCPGEAGVAENGGCPPADGDRDGIADAEDACPAEAGPVATKGCPDQDSDAVADAEDLCPSVSGPAATRGCPDQDGDAVADADDACPAQAGPAALKGCPDTDGDGIADRLDNCPKEKGEAGNAGCPAGKKQVVALEAKRISIKEKVYFETNRSDIQPRSFELLRQVAAVVRSHPDLAKVRVEGYTDDTGPLPFNMKLSKERADAVRAFLVNAGVEADRLEAVGHGPEDPVADNATPQGREQNRRVEFVTEEAAQ